MEKLLNGAVAIHVVDALHLMTLADVKRITGVEFEDQSEALEKLQEAIRNYMTRKEL
jgi:hypothetical protein